jgi:hypothetical protein
MAGCTSNEAPDGTKVCERTLVLPELRSPTPATRRRSSLVVSDAQLGIKRSWNDRGVRPPSPQTRTTVTARITAHIKQGWPQLDEPVVTHRGQFCYVAALRGPEALGLEIH